MRLARAVPVASHAGRGWRDKATPAALLLRGWRDPLAPRDRPRSARPLGADAPLAAGPPAPVRGRPDRRPVGPGPRAGARPGAPADAGPPPPPRHAAEGAGAG